MQEALLVPSWHGHCGAGAASPASTPFRAHPELFATRFLMCFFFFFSTHIKRFKLDKAKSVRAGHGRLRVRGLVPK